VHFGLGSSAQVAGGGQYASLLCKGQALLGPAVRALNPDGGEFLGQLFAGLASPNGCAQIRAFFTVEASEESSVSGQASAVTGTTKG
jgi:hypothetical protein